MAGGSPVRRMSDRVVAETITSPISTAMLFVVCVVVFPGVPFVNELRNQTLGAEKPGTFPATVTVVLPRAT
jgi:hypothetical protein